MMSGIITITLFPTIDNYLVVEKLEPNIKIPTTKPQYFIGGGGINISKALKNLGVSSHSIVLGGGFYKSLFIKLIEEEKIEFNILESKNLIRENIIITERNSNAEYRLNTPVDRISDEDFDLINAELNQLPYSNFVMISGNSGDGFPDSFLKSIIEMKSKNQFVLIVDTKGKGLKQFFNLEIDYIKPNFEEFLDLINQPNYTVEDIISNRTEILKNSKVKNILVSMGSKGLLYLTHHHHQFFPAIKVNSVSSVGAGDSMVAGLVAQLSYGQSIEESIQYGIACGAATTLEKSHHLCKKETVEELIKGDL